MNRQSIKLIIEEYFISDNEEERQINLNIKLTQIIQELEINKNI
jgi:hypothetical protein